MKNKKYIRRRIVCVLAAVILMVGNPVKNSLAEEMVSAETEDILQVSEEIKTTEILQDNNISEIEQNSNLEDDLQQEENSVSEIAENIEESIIDKETETIYTESVSNGAIEAASNDSLQVSAMKAKISTADYLTEGKHLKLNFTYKILGCVKVDSHLNVRKKSNTSSKIVGKLSNNTFCNVKKVYSNGWAKIKSGKVSGYVLMEYLLVGEKAEQVALKKANKIIKTKTSQLNVRSLPSTSTKIYTQLKKNVQMNIKYEEVTKSKIKNLLKKNKSLRQQISKSEKKKLLKESNLQNWVCIKYQGKAAFVSKEYVEIIYTVKTASVESDKQDSLREKIVKYAKKFVGNRYVYGGSSLKRGTDCSGFTMRVYQHFGYRLSRSSAAQSRNGKKIKRSQLKPGDLLFYKKGGRIVHVSMYIGNGKVIHASNEKNGITISSVSYRKACRYVRIVKG